MDKLNDWHIFSEAKIWTHFHLKYTRGFLLIFINIHILVLCFIN